MLLRKFSLVGTLVLVMAAFGCAGKNMASIPTATPGEVLIYSSEAQRPGWTLEEPDTKDGMMSFVGLSGFMATEKLARDDARRNATSSVVKYLGTIAKDKFEKVSTDFGLASDLVNPTESARAYEKQLAANMARQVKSKKWYIEKWQKPTGTGYKVFVLSQMPESVINDTLKNTSRDMVKKAEQQMKNANDDIAKKQAEKSIAFWKQMEEQGLAE